ncbi:MAG: NAD(P)/FAD-dependent oxidoreductase, partial [Cyanobacteria bacterium P01_H01_bin.121]
PFSRFQPRDTVQWFKQRGVQLKTEADGRMFPVSDRSETIADTLITAAKRAKVELATRSPVTQIEPYADQTGFIVQCKSGVTYQCRALVLATGSSPTGYRLATGLGHTLIDPVPSLFTFNIADAELQALAGVSVEHVDAQLTVTTAKSSVDLPERSAYRLTQTGPLLITHWGLSGPAILKLSAWGARALHAARYRAELRLNWLPHMKQEPLRSELIGLRSSAPKRQIVNQQPFKLPQRLWHYLLHRGKIPLTTRCSELSNKQIAALSEQLSRCPFNVSGKGVFKDEFVTCGGIPLPEIDCKTMASRRCPGLYLAGELLDVDGVTGGFNFQNAWTSGWLAGRAIASNLAPTALKH